MQIISDMHIHTVLSGYCRSPQQTIENVIRILTKNGLKKIGFADHLWIDDKIKSLQGNNPFGRCVWKCDNNVVDHQTVMIEFQDGATASLNMVGGAIRPMRKIHIIGTTGEIQGIFDDSKFVIRHFDPRPGKEYKEKEVDLMIGGDMTGAFGSHGGGDLRLVEDFVNVLRGKKASISCNSIDDSINGHLIGFLADKSREENGAVQMCSQSLYNLN